MILALLLAISAPAPVDADVQAVNSAVAALAPHLNESGTSLDGRPGSDRLVEAQWRAVQTWAAHWLDRHPGASPAALEKAGAIFGEDWSLSATSLGHGDVLISAARWQMGNSFILGRSGTGSYRLRWAIDAPQTRLNPAANRVLSYWRAASLNRRCEACRMMGGARFERLPNAADGAARFSIDAGYAQEIGATIGKQLSLWSWQNGRARPLLVHEYSVMVEQGGSALRGSVLHVTSKRDWQSLFACGSCYERETDLRFAIGPSRVRMLPPISKTPELDLIDRVFVRVLKRRPAGALASPSALRVIRSQLAEPLAEADPQLKGLAGMTMGWGRWRTRDVRWACLDVDGAGVTAFAFDAGLTRITEARVLKPDSCKGEGPHQW